MLLRDVYPQTWLNSDQCPFGDVVPANTSTVFCDKYTSVTWCRTPSQLCLRRCTRNPHWKPIFSQGSLPFVGCYRTGGASRLKEHGETPTLAGLWEAVLRVLCHWDLWLPLETLPALPRRQLQGKANVSGHGAHCSLKEIYTDVFCFTSWHSDIILNNETGGSHGRSID